jgi:HJR/Mrr/RecB family endonuclease
MAARRRRDFDIAMDVGRIVLLVIFAGVFVPPVRQMIRGAAMIAVGIAIFAVVVLVCATLIRRAKRTSFAGGGENVSLEAVLPSSCTPSGITQVETTADLLTRVRSLDWFQFEKFTALIYRRLGYSVIRRGGANADGGIDLVIEKDGQRSAVQCKQWKSWNVGVKTVREFLGALTDAKIQKGIFVTLCGYTGDAKQLADKHGIEIVNEKVLVGIIEGAGLSSDPEVLALLNDTKKVCPKCESEMILRTAKKGAGAGRQFWGCSTYPTCKFTMPS